MARWLWWQRLQSFVPASIAFGLGVWQLRRRQEKIRDIETCNRELALPPIDNVSLLQDEHLLESWAFRAVHLFGDWVHSETRLVGPRPCPYRVSRPGPSTADPFGYLVVTPFRVEGLGSPTGLADASGLNRWPILVNRGWISREQVATFWKHVKAVDENDAPSVELHAVPQRREKASFYMPRNRPMEYSWFRLDNNDLGGNCLLEELDERNSGQSDAKDPLIGLCVYRRRLQDLCEFYISPETHANYSMTWFTLSAALAFLGWYRNRRLSAP
jgi:surfeit locus 1 family protein